MHSELDEHGVDVSAGGGQPHAHRPGHARRALAPDQTRQHLALAGGQQVIQGRVARAVPDRPVGGLGGQREHRPSGAAAGQPAHSRGQHPLDLDEVVGLERGPVHADGERAGEAGRPGRIREHHEGGPRRAGHGLLQRTQLAASGQAEVEQAGVGLLTQAQLRGVVEPDDAADHLVTRPAQERLEGASEDRVCVGDHDSQFDGPPCAGSRTVTARPPRSLTPR